MSTTTRRLGARELIETVLDPGSWTSWDQAPEQPAVPDSDYAAELAAAAERAGTDEAVLSGSGRIAGRSIAVVVGEFGFLAGSIGHAASERLVAAIERATREGLPLVAAPASGGTRMQEGTPAFVGMVKVTAAITQHKNAGLPYLVYLRHPTTGGVFASWGSLGHVTVAEPGALIGFLGPRVYEALHGRPFPEGVQTAENLYARGLVDAVLPVEQLAEVADRALDVLTAGREGLPVPPEVPLDPLDDVPAWESIERSRRPDRPGVRDLLKLGASSVVPLHGTGEGENDAGMLIALAKFGDFPCVVLGQDRRNQTPGHPLGPAGLRQARRGMRLAHELQLPLVSVIDTAGLALSQEAEEGAAAGEIARSLADLVTLDTPTVCVLLGEGTGGAALALMPADRVIAAQHSWLSPLPPEGAAAILYRDPSRAPEVAAAQQVRSLDLLRTGIVDRVVSERPDAADEPAEFCDRMAQVLRHELGELMQTDRDGRLQRRFARYQALG
ncbi:carboxyl transferase domain-containing protein [Nocardioides speluncae]|uniref:carboxyl transferase domain-containing protein n=1 Tax=Nocardioides speluncae TaxID=2670337 RepID=UPI000D68DAE4|nr:carboxyl transferase domain-containing protein [Nocardioides speluncae]